MQSPIPPYQVKILVRLTDFLEDYPWLVQNVLRHIANAPVVRRYLWIVIRGFMGASAFDCHEVDVTNATVSFSGTKETFYPSCIMRIMKDKLVQKVGEERADEVIRKMAHDAMHLELEFGGEGNMFPKLINSSVGDYSAMEMVRSDPDMQRLVDKGMGLLNRFIHDEGGYGRIEADFSEDPIKVTITNSLQSRLAGHSDRPVCSLSVGTLEGTVGYLLGDTFKAREVECAAMGAPRCVFEVTRESAT
jgi:uncharacterized protein